MARVGLVHIFNLMPYDLDLQINGKRVDEKLPTHGNSRRVTMAEFPRILADTIDGVARFVTSNRVEVSGEGIRQAFNIRIDPDNYDIDNDVTLCIFDGGALLIKAADGKPLGELVRPD